MHFVDDRNAAPRHMFTLLGGRPIHDIGYEIGPYPRKIHQRVALGRSPVGANLQSLAFSFNEKVDEVVLHLLCLRLEPLIESEAFNSRLGFRFLQCPQAVARRVFSCVFPLRIDAEASSMRRQLFNVEHGETVRRENARDGSQREVGIVLVIDGVELVLTHEVEKVREFESRNAFRLKQTGEA